MLVVRWRYLLLSLSLWVCIHRVALLRRRILIVLRLSISAPHHPSVICEGLEALLHSLTCMDIAADEED